jgi:hypothetical protein
MTKSRIALLLLTAAGPVAAAAQSPVPAASAEEAIAAGQALVRQTVRPGCAEGGEEIVVCGRRDEDEKHRLPLRVEPAPRAADSAGGEQLAAIRTDTSRCTTVGQNPRCGGGLPVIPIALWLLESVVKAMDGED